MIELLQTSTPVFIATTLVLGLLIGSFLNVVIYRLPVIMKNQWQQQCNEMNNIAIEATDPFGLSKPRSRCSHCGHGITAVENIPVVSYLLLRGKCSQCNQPIAKRYPLIEVLTGLLSAITAWRFGFDWACLGGLLLTWSLIALTFIDVDHQLLPDSITLPLLWTGIFFNLFGTYVDLHASVVGAISGYLWLWLIFHLFRLITGKEGMGYGDFKLLAALGAWLGWPSLPLVIILSSLVGAVIGISLILLKRHKRGTIIPFGPYLAVAGWIALIGGEEINALYLSWTVSIR